MKVRKITYSRGRTINLENFESLRFDMGAEAELDDGESFDVAYQALKSTIDAAVRAEAKRVRAHLEAQAAARGAP